MKVLRWLADHWYIPLTLLGAVVGFLLSRSTREKGTPLAQTKAEVKAIEAQREVREVKAQLGAEAAKKHVADKYREKRETLDEKTKKQAEALEDDPEKLAKLLERASR